MCPAASDKETAQPQTCIHLAPRLRWSHRRGIAYDPLFPAAVQTRFRARSKHASRLCACRACRACHCQAVAGASLGGPWRLCLRLGAAWGQMTASRIRPSLGVPARRPAFSISHPPAFVSTSSMSAADAIAFHKPRNHYTRATWPASSAAHTRARYSSQLRLSSVGGARDEGAGGGMPVPFIWTTVPGACLPSGSQRLQVSWK